MKVHEMAKSAGTTPEAVRYYVRIGLLHPGRDPVNGYRDFDGEDLSLLRFIRQARGLGFTIAEITEIVAQARCGNSSCPGVRRILQSRLSETRCRVAELAACQARMEEALAQWNGMPGGAPDGRGVHDLIESAGRFGAG